MPAPENHLSAEIIQAAKGRRGFLATAAAGGIARGRRRQGRRAGEGRAAGACSPWTRTLGAPVGASGYGMPSKYESAVQRRQSPGLTPQPQSSVSFTPLQNLFGIITPSGVHFERHHSGVPEVDPAQHRLMIHGLVKRPLVLTMDDIMRFPSVSRIHFIECGANSGMEWGNVAVPTVQYSHGMLACSEFTGVLLSTLLDEVGYDKKNAKFVLAEGADGSALTRTIPIEFALNDVMVVYGQNGEMLRPENGYPLRLLVPGVQGVSSVKWLRRLEVGDKPWNAREESMHYIDLMPDGTHRQYSGVQEVKSVITTPSGGQMLQGKGYYEITGPGLVRPRQDQAGRRLDRRRPQLAAGAPAGSGAVEGADALPAWTGTGTAARRCCRAGRSTRPATSSRRSPQLRAVRGTRSIYHNNAIKTWSVQPSGEVWNVQIA